MLFWRLPRPTFWNRSVEAETSCTGRLHPDGLQLQRALPNPSSPTSSFDRQEKLTQLRRCTQYSTSLQSLYRLKLRMGRRMPEANPAFSVATPPPAKLYACAVFMKESCLKKGGFTSFFNLTTLKCRACQPSSRITMVRSSTNSKYPDECVPATMHGIPADALQLRSKDGKGGTLGYRVMVALTLNPRHPKIQ